MSEAAGPRTHLLAIGSPQYPRIGSLSLPPPFGEGITQPGPMFDVGQFADWMSGEYENPALVGLTELITAEGWSGAIREAAARWRDACDADDGNLAVFYYSGVGVRAAEDLILFAEDIGDPTQEPLVGAFSLNGLMEAMASCRARRQLFIVDVVTPVTAPEFGPPPALLGPSSKPDRPPPEQALIQFSAIVRSSEQLQEFRQESSPFLKALIDSLRDAPGTGPVRVSDIAEGLRKRLGPQGLDVRLQADFPFHRVRQAQEAPVSAASASNPLGETATSPPPRQPPRPGTKGAATSRAVPPQPKPPKPPPASSKSPRKPPIPPPAPPPARPPLRADTRFLDDNAETRRDRLGRGVTAMALAQRLHLIWSTLNDALPRQPPKPEPSICLAAWLGADHPAEPDERAAFVLHVDAPWGGGKTSFANFLSRVLCPIGPALEDDSFLRDRFGTTKPGAAFLTETPGAQWPHDGLRPWIVVPFNAWQVEDSSPPWWIFYRTIRRACFRAVLHEGRRPFAEGPVDPPATPWYERWEGFGALWTRELVWRLTSRKVFLLLATFAASVGLIGLLLGAGLLDVQGEKGKEAVGWVAKGAGGVLGALTAVTGVWGLGALLVDSVAPGADVGAEKLTLGREDPFDRFRRHFTHTMLAVRRPVLVIIDDLDRCRPEFIVGLVRGIQTVLRSPRVVFAVLGDRNWIERAFEVAYTDMEEADDEHSFGARFVEKAIQLSFVLPDVKVDQQKAFVRALLIGDPAAARLAPVDPPKVDAIRAQVAAEAADPTAPALATEAATERILSRLPNSNDADKQRVAEEVAIRLTATSDVDVAHALLPLAPLLPVNPRQIKRIINAVTVYGAVSRAVMNWYQGAEPWMRLARWVVIMHRWPETWRQLSLTPALVDQLASDTKGRSDETRAFLAGARSNDALMSLLRGDGAEDDVNVGGPITAAVVKDLLTVIPLTQSASRPARAPATEATA